MKDYVFQQKFSQWLHQKSNAKRTAVLIGIRAQESLNRYATVTRNNTVTMFGTIRYSFRIAHNVFNFYPSYKRMCIMILKNDISCRYMGLKKDVMYL